VDGAEGDTRHPGRVGRAVTKRKRVASPPRHPARPNTTYDARSGPPGGVIGPSGGFEPAQYSPAGEGVVFANLFRGLQRRWRKPSQLARRKL
jgi:hypothetical protein